MALFYRLSTGTLSLSGSFPKYLATNIITWWRHQWRHKVWINSPCGPYRHCSVKSHRIGERCVQTSYSFVNDVTVMTPSGHVRSLGTCPIDSAYALSYRLLIGNITLSGLVSEIYSDKIITWWRHQWRHKACINNTLVRSMRLPSWPNIESRSSIFLLQELA